MKSLKYIFMAAAVSLSLASCMDGDDSIFNNDWKDINNSEAPYGNNSITEENVTTIAKLKTYPAYAKAISDGKYEEITFDIKIKGRIVGNDIAGNIYKEVYIQDATGAIKVGVNKAGLSGYMAIGQEILVDLKGLYIGGYGGVPQLGTPYNGGIGRMAESIWMQHFKLIGKPDESQIKPIAITKESDLKDNMIGKLVVLKNVTFKNADGTQTLISGSPANGNYYHKELDNFSKDVVIRTSSYADFAATKLPFKEGAKVPVNLIGILSKYNSTWQFMIRKTTDITDKEVDAVDPSDDNGNTPLPAGDTTGDGTLDNPYTPADMATVVANLTWTSNNVYDKTDNVYVKGKISRIADNGTFSQSGTYGNASFYISEDGSQTNEFYCFRILYLGNQKYTSGPDIKVGDEVIIYGKVMNYKGNTPETVAGEAYLYSLNNVTTTDNETVDPDDDPIVPSTGTQGDGTLNNPYSVSEAISAVSRLTWTSNTEYEKTGVVYVKGRISRIANKGKFGESGTYGNASFYISDDGSNSNEFYCFRILYLDNQKYTSGTDISVGDDVIICGKLMNYKGNTPETVANEAYLYALSSIPGTVIP